MNRPVEVCFYSDEQWMRVLKNYDWPNRPCNSCVDGCRNRLSCPIFRAWEYLLKGQNNGET